MIMKLVSALIGLAALGGVALSSGAASAMPAAVPAQSSSVIPAAYTCNEWGHCWHQHYDGGGYYHPHYWGGWHRHWDYGWRPHTWHRYWHPHYWGGWGWHRHWGYGGWHQWHHWHYWHQT
jgi:hypothetical protein